MDYISEEKGNEHPFSNILDVSSIQNHNIYADLMRENPGKRSTPGTFSAAISPGGPAESW